MTCAFFHMRRNVKSTILHLISSTHHSNTKSFSTMRSAARRSSKPALLTDWLETRDLMAVGFPAIALADQFNLNPYGSASIPPDTMGAVGPNHFVELINSSMAIYDKTGTRQIYIYPDTFFSTVQVGGTFDPRILYDRESGRWFATIMERGVGNADNDVLLAVSKTSDPTWNTSTGSPKDSWNFYRIDVSVPTAGGFPTFTDYSTLGVDSTGVFFGASYFVGSPVTAVNAKIAAMFKAPLIAATPSLGTLTVSGNITDMYSTP